MLRHEGLLNLQAWFGRDALISSIDTHWQATSDLRRVFLAAFPIWLSFSFGAAIAFNDMQLAGRLGPQAQAAMGLCETVWCLFALVASGIAGGAAACVSQSLGAEDMKTTRKCAINALIISTVVGALLLVAAFFLGEYLCEALSCSPGVTALAVSYMRLSAIGNLPYAIMQAQLAIFRSVGRPQLGLLLWLVAGLFEIGGTQYSFSPFSVTAQTNLNAVAVFWDIGCFSSISVGFFLLHRLRKAAPQIAINVASDFSIPLMKQIVSVGLPLVCAEAAIIVGQLFVYRLLGSLPDGVHWQAIWAIKSRVEETLILSPLMALSLAIAAHSGFGVGAGKQAQAMRTAWRSALASFAMVAALALVVYIWAPAIFMIWGGSAELSHNGGVVLSISAGLWPWLALSLILLGVFEGIGKTVSSTIFTGLIYCPLRLLLALLLPLFIAPSLGSVLIIAGLPQLIGAAGIVILFARERERVQIAETDGLRTLET